MNTPGNYGANDPKKKTAPENPLKIIPAKPGKKNDPMGCYSQDSRLLKMARQALKS